MKNKIFAVSALALALAACDDNDITAGTNNVEGTVEIGNFTASGIPFVTRELEAVISDPNGIDSSTVVAYQWMADNEAITGATSNSYVLIEADQGAAITVSAEYIDNDGFPESVVSTATELVTATPTNTTGTITISGSANVGEELEATVDDANTVSTDISYQWFRDNTEIDGATNDEYELVDEDFGAVITVQATYEDDDGFSEDITSVGTAAVAEVLSDDVPTTQVAQISDTTNGDTGELRLNPDEDTFTSLIEGRLEFSFISEELVRTSPSAGTSDGGISIMGSSTSTSAAFVDLRLQNGTLRVRNSDPDLTVDYAFDEVVDVVVTWDGTANTDSNASAPLVSVSINGQLITPDGFTSVSNNLGSLVGGVDRFQFRVGDSDDVATGSIFIDDLVIYSDAAGNTPVFTENFDSLVIGDTLVSANRFSGGGSEAVVAEIDLPGADDTNALSTIDGQAVSITDTTADTATDSGAGDTGELRYNLDAPLEVGSASFNFSRSTITRTASSDADDIGDDGDTFVTLFGSDGSSSQALIQVRFRNSGAADVDGSDDGTGSEFSGSYTLDQDTTVELTWDASNATADVAPLINVSIDGVLVSDTAFSPGSTSSSTALVLANIQNGLERFQIRVNENDSSVSGAMIVDNIVITNTETDTIVFSENFDGTGDEEFVVGDIESTENATANRFASETQDATIVDTDATTAE